MQEIRYEMYLSAHPPYCKGIYLSVVVKLQERMSENERKSSMHQKTKIHFLFAEDNQQTKHIKAEASTTLTCYKSSNWTEQLAVFTRLKPSGWAQQVNEFRWMLNRSGVPELKFCLEQSFSRLYLPSTRTLGY